MEKARRRLVERLREEIDDPRVIQVMERVPRERYVPEYVTHAAYEDTALPIGEGQTISQPYIVALMVSAAEIRRTDKALEVGTGSGYQTAILAELAESVVSVERLATLADAARVRLQSFGYSNAEVFLSQDELGWPPGAPYDAIIVAAGAPKLPMELIAQLEVGGRLVAPVGSLETQELMKVVRTNDGMSVRSLGACRFVPLIGKGAWPESDS